MSVKQFSAVYSPVEDRIVFGFNTNHDELYQFLLTRSMAKSFLNQSDLIAEKSLSSQHNERSSKLISEFQKESLKKQINFEEVFEGGEKTPLGKDPILVTEIGMQLQADSVRISLTLINSQIVGFSLPAVQVQALSLLLEKLATQAHWEITSNELVSVDAVTIAPANPPPQIH